MSAASVLTPAGLCERGCRLGTALAFAAAVLLQPASALAQSPPAERMTIDSRPIERFRIGSDETRFGPFEFVGGLSMASRGRHFGGLSGFRYLAPGSDFIGVTDTGFWFFGRIERNDDRQPMGVTDFRMTPMVDAAGAPLAGKQEADAEGLEVHGGIATVSFERQHRVTEFALQPDAMGRPLRDVDFLVPRRELRQNRGFETVARAPEDSMLAGARVIVAERSIDEDGNLFAAILEGPLKGVFKVARGGDFDVTDGAFLPDGDLLLLERRFSMAQGVAMRLRRIEADTIRPGGLADGPVLLEADMAYQIDNMEGLDVWRREDGALMVSLVSDDNHSILQRNLYLEFQLIDE